MSLSLCSHVVKLAYMYRVLQRFCKTLYWQIPVFKLKTKLLKNSYPSKGWTLSKLLLFQHLYACSLHLPSYQVNSRESKSKIFLGMLAPRPPSRHTCLCACEHAFAHYYNPATILFSPPSNSKSCMKPWLLPLISTFS